MKDPKAISFVSRNRWLLAFVLVAFSGCADNSAPDPAEDPQAHPSSANAPVEGEPWTRQDLMDPAELAKIIEDPGREDPVILDIGGVGHIMGGRIKGAEVIGPTSETENLAKLGAAVDEYPEDIDLVIYCGCCPFEDCPNIRPAFQMLQQMQFTNLKLLDIPENLRVDWANRGYPTEEE